MPRTLYLIHHTHTDVGYTELQGRILDRQVDFIRQALRLVEADERFRWTCETFWAVEQFLKVASPDEKARFVRAVKSGRIGLSASYLNFSELLDYATHRDLMRRVQAFGEANGITVRSSMTADINGHSLAFAQALRDHGVEQLFTCVHAHHGMYPLFKNQTPFYWQMPNGERLLVWNGEHYHLGNELGLVPGAFMTRMVEDAVRPGEALVSIAERRVPAYWRYLASQGYAYDFAPLMISGLMTDNAPPAPGLTDYLDAWNQRHGDEVRLVLGTLETFFDALRSSEVEIPTYEGLWPDWWADLTAAAPAATQIFRQAQRRLALYRYLVEPKGAAPPVETAVPGQHEDQLQRRVVEDQLHRGVVEDQLALFAEHTFGHSGSYTHPDHLLVAACSYRKSAYAAEALEGAVRLLDAATNQLGAAGFEAGRPLRFTVTNPNPHRFVGPVRLELDPFECGDVEVNFEPEGSLPPPVPGFSVTDVASGTALPSQAVRVPRGIEVVVWLEVESGGSRSLQIDAGGTRTSDKRDPAGAESPAAGDAGRIDPPAASIRRSATRADRPFLRVTPTRGIDGAEDVASASQDREDIVTRATPGGGEHPEPVARHGRDVTRAPHKEALETPFVRIEWTRPQGIVSWVDKRSGRELLDPVRAHPAFSPMHEVSPASPRTLMGRNRKGANVVRSAGALLGSGDARDSDLFSAVLLDYELPGTRQCALLLRAYHVHPFVEVEFAIHKETSSDVESIYLSLPLKAGPDAELWIDTSVRPMRPWKDQVPGTLTDFFHVFDGVASVEPGFGVGLAMPDTPLLQLGDLAFKPRLLGGMDALREEVMRPYAWLMNNFWETNANIDLAGYFRFRFGIFWGEEFASPEEIFRTCRNLNGGPVTFRRA